MGSALVGALALSGAAVAATPVGAATIQGQSGLGSTYYVDQNGSGTDCSQSLPCASLEQAFQTAGNNPYSVFLGTITIQVGPGDYYENNNVINAGGPFLASITVIGVPGKTTFTSDGSQPAIVNDCASLNVQGIEFVNYTTALVNACGYLTVENSTFDQNSTGIDAGNYDGNSFTTITNSTFYQNGWGVSANDYGTDIENSTFFMNEGGAITAADYQLTVNNDTITRNGYAVKVEDGYASISSSTINANEYGVANFSGTDNVALTGTILANNFSYDCNGAQISDNSYNIDTRGDCGLNSNNNFWFDPQLGSLQDNGGYTWTEAVVPGSSAYNKIPVAYCPMVDQRGESRPQTAGSQFCDIGAYEYGAPKSLAFVSSPLTGPTSTDANVGPIQVQALDAQGLPAVSAHTMILNLSTSAPSSHFALTSSGSSTSTAVIPAGSTTGSFYVGDCHPMPVPVTVAGSDAITSLGSISQTETVVTGPAASVTKTAGDAQSTAVGTAFGTNLAVNVVDGTNNPVDNEPVLFTVTGGATFPGGSTTATVNSDVNGNAVAPVLTAGTVPGPVTVAVTTSVSGVGTSFTETQVVGPPAQFTINSGEGQNVLSSHAFPTPLETTLSDSYGNPISGATVDYTVSSGSATFAGSSTTSAVTNASGQSTVSGLIAGFHAGVQTITATAHGTSVSITFSSISITAPASTATVSPFALGSSTLTSGLQGQVAAIAATITKYGNTHVVLSGYADNSGSKTENTKLSLLRAAAVKTSLLARLKALHVSGVSISTVGKGATGFIGGNGNLPANRRVVAALN